jgi:hypothetical protein
MIKAITIYNKIGRLRKAIMAEGTPKIQDAWSELEPHVSTFMNAGGRDGASREDGQDHGGPSHMGKP